MTNDENIKQSQPMRDRRLWTSIGVLTTVAAIVSAIFGIGGPRAQASANPSAPQAVPVSVAAVSESEVKAWTNFPAGSKRWSASTCAHASRAPCRPCTSAKACW